MDHLEVENRDKRPIHRDIYADQIVMVFFCNCHGVKRDNNVTICCNLSDYLIKLSRLKEHDISNVMAQKT